MATAEDYAAWIVKNKDKKGTPQFETVAAAYKLARQNAAQAAPQADQQAAPQQPPEPSFIDNVLGAYAEPLAAIASGTIAKPASDIAGLAAIPLHAAGIIDKMPEDVKSSVQQGLTYQPRTAVGKAVTEYNPLSLAAKGVDWLGSKAEQAIVPSPNDPYSPARAALGAGVHEAINQAPAFLALKMPGAANAASSALKQSARDTMQSALKPPIAAQRTGQAAAAINTMLDEGINVSRGGLEKLRGKIDVLDQGISDAIANSNATVGKQAVGYRLQDLLDRAQKQVNPSADVAAIQKAWDEFVTHPQLPDQIPVQLAQEMKQGTYRSLGDKAYGELKGADMEAQKTLARGLKEEIATAVPEVRPLNAAESKLLQALPLVERRVLMEANKNPMGLGALAAHPTQFAAWIADRSGLFKSLVARMPNTASEIVPSRAVTTPGVVAGASLPQQRPAPALTGVLMPRQGLLGQPSVQQKRLGLLGLTPE